MNGSDEGITLPGIGNPFPSAAVARVFDLDIDVPTVDTQVIREATERLDAYLVHDREFGRSSVTSGTVVAIVGDYGTGKTHLATHLLRRVIRLPSSDVQFMYIDAQAGSFLALYRGSFITKLDHREVGQRVREYYADIVADSLEGTSAFPVEVTRRLRDGKIDPQRFVQQFGLMESTFLQVLREQLQQVTGNEQFGTALMLLLRGGFDSELWEWFGGGGPDPRLVEREITTPIDSDSAALEAIGVFALLYGGRDHRFILVIDELERVLSTSDRPPDVAIDAFKTLLSVAAHAGVFLVLSGLPDFLEVLGDNVRDRIGPVLRTSDLDPSDVVAYVGESLRAIGHNSGLSPFSENVIGYLTWLAGGNARRVIQLCHASYRLSVGTEPVSEATVRRAARDHFQVTTLDDVRTRTRRQLDTGGYQVLTMHRVGGKTGPQVDFWIPLGPHDTGGAITLTDSVLGNERCQELVRLAREIRDAAPATRTLLIVNGYLPPAFRTELRNSFTDEPIGYEARRFAEDLDAALHRMSSQLQSTETNDMAAVRTYVERMTSMQTNTQRFVEQLALQVETMRSVSDRQLATIQRDLDRLSEEGSTPPRQPSRELSPSDTHTWPPRSLPSDVEQLFIEALSGLQVLSRVGAVLQGAFSAERTEAGPNVRASRTVLHRLGEDGIFDAVGVAALVQTTVESFHDGLGQWYAELNPETFHNGLREDDRSGLAGLCRAYDSVFEYLPLFRLDELADLTTHISAHDEFRSELLDGATSPVRRVDIRTVLDGLAADVQSTILNEFGLFSTA